MTAPTPELDRAIIRRALDVVQVWDATPTELTEFDVVTPPEPLSRAVESLRAALTAAGYLEGGDRG